MNPQSALADLNFETTALAVGGRGIPSSTSMIIYKSDKVEIINPSE